LVGAPPSAGVRDNCPNLRKSNIYLLFLILYYFRLGLV
jgi:hypothetical protein